MWNEDMTARRDMSESPTWAPQARRYEICEALGVDPWSGPVSSLNIVFSDDKCVIDYRSIDPLTLSHLAELADLFQSGNVSLDVNLGYRAIDYEREAYGGHFRIVVKRDVAEEQQR